MNTLNINSNYYIYTNGTQNIAQILFGKYNIYIQYNINIKNLYYILNINSNNIYSNYHIFINTKKQIDIIKYYIKITPFNVIKTLYYLNDIIYLINNKYYILQSKSNINIKSVYQLQNIINIKSQYQIFYTFNKSMFILTLNQFKIQKYDILTRYGPQMTSQYYDFVYHYALPFKMQNYSIITKYQQLLPTNRVSLFIQLKQIQILNYSILNNIKLNILYNYSDIIRISTINNIISYSSSIETRYGTITFASTNSIYLHLNKLQIYNQNIFIQIAQQIKSIDFSFINKISDVSFISNYSLLTQNIYNYSNNFAILNRLTTFSSFILNNSILINYNIELFNSSFLREFWVYTYKDYPQNQISLENDING